MERGCFQQKGAALILMSKVITVSRKNGREKDRYLKITALKTLARLTFCALEQGRVELNDLLV